MLIYSCIEKNIHILKGEFLMIKRKIITTIALAVSVLLISSNNIVSAGQPVSSSKSSMHLNWNTNAWVGYNYIRNSGLVASVQAMCEAVGFNPGTIDGIYGTNTKNAIMAFQGSEGLYRDGVVGGNTWSHFEQYRIFDGSSPLIEGRYVIEYYRFAYFGNNVWFKRNLDSYGEVWTELNWILDLLEYERAYSF